MKNLSTSKLLQVSASAARQLSGIFAFAALSASTCVFGADEPVTAAVASQVSPDYVRAKLPNGSFEPETYAFGEGGYWAGGLDDKTIDKIAFKEVGKVMATALSLQNYRS